MQHIVRSVVTASLLVRGTCLHMTDHPVTAYLTRAFAFLVYAEAKIVRNKVYQGAGWALGSGGESALILSARSAGEVAD